MMCFQKVIGRDRRRTASVFDQSAYFDGSLLEVLMSHLAPGLAQPAKQAVGRTLLTAPRLSLLLLLFMVPLAAHAQGSPFDTGFNSLQTLFTGTVAKVASLIAIVIGGYSFAHGEPGAKKALAGVAVGTGIAVLAANVLSWLWGV
jgi:type IV secretory pathway VirB2 component (pilin)